MIAGMATNIAWAKQLKQSNRLSFLEKEKLHRGQAFDFRS